jgi:hypothetical protein
MKTISMWRLWAIVSVISAVLACDMPSFADETDLKGSGVSVGPVVEGKAFNQVLAGFTDPDDPTATPANFNALINWGDGSISTGTITTNGSGFFGVAGTHAYSDEFAGHIASITITSVGESGSITLTDTINVAEAEILTGTLFTASLGTPFSGQVGSFTDLNLLNTAADFTGVINWGDGSISTATFSTGGGGLFNINGNHTYTLPGQFTLLSNFQLDGVGDDIVVSTVDVTRSTSVPEPSSTLLLCAGLGLLTLMSRRPGRTPNLKLKAPEAS